MNKYISKHDLELRRIKYKAGRRVELVSMSDPYSTLKPGDRGVVEAVDDIGTVFCRWDNGSTLGAAYGADEIKLVPIPMTDTIRSQIMAVRESGACNMCDSVGVWFYAQGNGFDELAEYIEISQAAYMNFILTGEATDDE